MDLASPFLQTIDTIVDAKIQKFDRTIQAIVTDNSDINKEGEIKVSYKNAIFPVYTDRQTVKNYPKGSHVYVTIPNNDMGGRKTIVGLVEKIGPLTVITDEDKYSLNAQYVTKDITIKDNDDSKQESEIIFNSNSSRQDNWKNFLTQLKKLAIPNNYLRINMLWTVMIPEEYRKSWTDLSLSVNYLDANGGIICFGKLDTNGMVGTPYCQLSQKQSLIIDTTSIDNEQMFSQVQVLYHRKFGDLTLDQIPKSQDFLIEISDFSIDVLTTLESLETEDLMVYISTPKGKVFLREEDVKNKDSDFLTLNAVLKENRVQLDNTGLRCYWYIRDNTFDTNAYVEEREKDKYYSIRIAAGSGWSLITDPEDSKSDYPKPLMVNPYIVYRTELKYRENCEYKVVVN
jgi:hypothetical protein